MKPHVHAEVIKAWADGAEIEYYSQELNCWQDIGLIDRCTAWHKGVQYRVKPKTVVKYHGIMQGTDGYKQMNHNTGYHSELSNVRSSDTEKWKLIAIVKTRFLDGVPIAIELVK